MKTARLIGPALLLCAATARAHVGSPDVFYEGEAGPYRVFVTIRPPLTIPGVAELEVRCEAGDARKIRAVPLAMVGAGSNYAPIPDVLEPSPDDARFFKGQLWLMSSGSWRARLDIEGAQGAGTVAVPVASVARASKRMQFGLGALLSGFGAFLAVGLVALIGASAREAKLDPGRSAQPSDNRRGRRAVAIAALLVAASLAGGALWWNAESQNYDLKIYKPLAMSATLQGGDLELRLQEPGWMQAKSPADLAWRVFTRKMDDFVPDHGHIMHLYMLRDPGLDAAYHLHPEQRAGNFFALPLPEIEAGRYRLYADVVHADGLAETLTASIDLPQTDVPQTTGRALSGDDAFAKSEPWERSAVGNTSFTLPDGYKMEFLNADQPVREGEARLFSFRLVKPGGEPPEDMALYMGMLGHAAFVSTDGSVFAHIHPNGSASMAALMLAEGMPASMDMPAPMAALPNVVSFPYALPKVGRYRAFVQMKHGAMIETGIFDILCSPRGKRR